MLLRLACVSVLLTGCSKKTELYEIPLVGEPTCPTDPGKIGQSLTRDIVVMTTKGKDFSKQIHTGIDMGRTARPSGIVLHGKEMVKIAFQLCAPRGPGLMCDVANAVTYAEREVELDPERLNKVDGRRATKNPLVIDFVWPDEPLTCQDGTTPVKQKPRP